MSNITYDYIRKSPVVQTYISSADNTLGNIGYTEHSNAHVERAADSAYMILKALDYDERTCELAQIAAYMHDIGNVVNRVDHAQSSALMAFKLLDDLGMPPEEIALIISAIGNHDEHTAAPVTPIAAALIIADKTDVRRSRVRVGKHFYFKNKDSEAEQPVLTPEQLANDIHDRVNYAAESSILHFSDDKKRLVLELAIDTKICPVIDYFEIFLDRMNLCRISAKALGIEFGLVINNSPVL